MANNSNDGSSGTTGISPNKDSNCHSERGGGFTDQIIASGIGNPLLLSKHGGRVNLIRAAMKSLPGFAEEVSFFSPKFFLPK